jgi:3'-5' exonuclease
MEQLSNLLFLDIETVPIAETFEGLDEEWRKLWSKKAQYFIADESEEANKLAYESRAGIFSEFGKVIVIGLGFFSSSAESKREFRVKSLMDNNEKTLLEEFVKIIEQLNKPGLKLVAHNGKEFDFPYLSRRMLINGVKIPTCLDNSGKKPWEVQHIDTLEMWKFGDRKNFTSLDLLAKLFDLPSSKQDIDGSMVAKVYYKDKDLERIAKYCTEDVVVCTQVYLKLTNQKILEESEIFRR